MQTQIQTTKLSPEARQQANDILRSCVHCGFCLPTCPTYDLLANELDSPRGRIYLIKQALENKPVSTISLIHLDRCLGCRACETACPSGVKYTQLLAIGRSVIEKSVQRAWWQKFWRYSVRKTLTTPWLFNTLVRAYPWLKAKHSSNISLPTTQKAQIKFDKKVLLLSGCVQPVLAPNINHSIIQVLNSLGYEVLETSQSQCCGAIDQHLAAETEALKKIKHHIDQCYQQLEQGFTAIISAASGCGVMIQDYPHLLEHDPAYATKAKVVADKTQDIAEFLSTENLATFIQASPKNISLHTPCSLQHGLKINHLVEEILTQIGYVLEPIEDAHLCCGSAGTYSIFQPKLSKQLRQQKLHCLQVEQPDIIVTANIGCLVHLQAATKTPVKHWIELLN